MTAQSIIHIARYMILSCGSIDQLPDAERNADKFCNDAVRSIRYAQDCFPALVELRRAQLEGKAVLQAPPGAEWVSRAREVDWNDSEGHEFLHYIHVVEWNNLTWMVAADGFRLHAHGCAAVPLGLYGVVEGHLIPAPVDVKVRTQLMSIIDPETQPIGKLPSPALFEDSEYNDRVGWGWENGYLVSAEASECTYSMNQDYLSDAMSLSAENPQYGYKAKLTGKRKTEVWAIPLQLFWENAFALIMPMKPVKGMKGYKGY